MSSGFRAPRYRFALVEEPETTLPVLYRRPPPVREAGERELWIRRMDPMELLIEALWRLNLRGEGDYPFAAPLAENPLLFLLDAIGDAVSLRWSDGRLVYANPAAWRLGSTAGHASEEVEVIQLEGHSYERRTMSYRTGKETLLLEVLRRID